MNVRLIAHLCASLVFVLGIASHPSTATADAYDDYVRLTADDSAPASGTGINQSFDNNDNGRWKKNGVPEPTGPHAGEKYYIDHLLCTSNVEAKAGNPVHITFAGDELVLAGRLWIVLKRSTVAADDAIIEVPRMTGIANGNIYNSNSKPAKIIGELTVTATSSNPFLFFNWCKDGRPRYGVELVGDTTACAYFKNQDSVSTTGRTIFSFVGDATRYHGTLMVTGGFSTLSLETPGGFTCPGTIQVSNDAIVSVPSGSPATIGNLDCDGGILVLASPLTVTNAFTAGGTPIKVATTVSANAEKIALLTLAPSATGTLSLEDFRLSFSDCTMASKTGLSKAPETLVASLSVETNELTGARTLYMSHRAIVYHDAKDASNGSDSAFLEAGASHWSDNDIPNPDRDYYSVDKNFPLYVPNAACTFGGASFTIGGTSYLNFNTSLGNKTLTVRMLRFVPMSPTNLLMQAWGSGTLAGGMEIVGIDDSYWARFYGWNASVVTINSTLSGSGNLLLSCHHEAQNDSRVLFKFTGDASAYAGRMRVYHPDYEKATYIADPDYYSATVIAGGEENLGGPLAAFAADGLSLEQHALLQLTGDGTGVFDEPTRGWRIVGCGRIEVPADSTAVVTNKQITYAGEFRKMGAGRLVLGGTARFTEEATETPLAGTNVLTIAAGSLTPASATAFDGLAISFAAGTKLVLNAAATGDLLTCGIKDVKWDTPLTFADDALAVEFADAANVHELGERRVAICTVNATAAKSLSTSSFAVKPPRRMSTTVVSVVNQDGSTTFACDLACKGLVLIVK